MKKAFKYRIYPNKETAIKIDQTIETCRRLYNRLLAQRLMYLDNCYDTIMGMQNPSYTGEFCFASHGLPITKYAGISRYTQQKYIKEWKRDDPYLKAVYSNSLISVAIKLENSYKGFFDRCKKKSKGLLPPDADVGVPRFKGRPFYNSFTYESGQGFKIIDNWLELSKIGMVKVKFHRPIEGKIKTCTIKREGNEYYAVFSCEVDMQKAELTGKQVGIDLGISNYIATSEGELIEGLRIYREQEKLIAHLQKLKANKKRGSRRYNELARIIAKKHLMIKRKRLDIVRNIVFDLLKKYDIICHEDLRISNMVQNKHLSKSITDAAWAIFIDELNKKASMIEGKQVIAVDPKNTSQKCSGCGEIVKKSLSDRWHSCPNCGLEIDRDVNAAINILKIGTGENVILSIPDSAKMPGVRQAEPQGQLLLFL